VVKQDNVFNPVYVSFFGTDGIVFNPQDLTMQLSGSRISQGHIKVPEHARSAAFRRFFDPFLMPSKMNRIVAIFDVDVALESVICLSGISHVNSCVENPV